MKKSLLLLLTLSSLLALPQNQTPLPTVHMASVPHSLQQQPVVLLPALVIGAGIGIAGWAGIKIWQGALRAWEHKITNEAPAEVVFTLEPEDESGQ